MATADQIIAETAPATLIDHNLIDKDVESLCDGMVQYEKRPAKRRDGSVVEGLYNAWIIFNNPKQFNSYTTDMVKACLRLVRFFARESCGKCTPCRVGAIRGTEVMDRIIAREAPEQNLGLLEDLCETMELGSLCAMGGLTPNPVRSALKYFPEDFA